MILQNALPFAPWMHTNTARLPGVQPVAMPDWLQVDEAYSAQLAEKARLIEMDEEAVLSERPAGEAAANELLELVIAQLSSREDFERQGLCMRRPDGALVELASESPLKTLAQLIQEDIAILTREGDEHVLQSGLICFPASWTLAEKIGRPLSAIHDPVETYTSDMARRVQRLFDAVRVGQPLTRANALRYVDPDLFQPRQEGVAKPYEEGAPAYMRSERQVILRLPKTDAVVFTIHTYVVRWSDLSPEQRNSWPG